ncbi:MAG: hypothetical protein Q9202_004720 [Teloschistes flavicans]
MPPNGNAQTLLQGTAVLAIFDSLFAWPRELCLCFLICFAAFLNPALHQAVNPAPVKQLQASDALNHLPDKSPPLSPKAPHLSLQKLSVSLAKISPPLSPTSIHLSPTASMLRRPCECIYLGPLRITQSSFYNFERPLHFDS